MKQLTPYCPRIKWALLFLLAIGVSACTAKPSSVKSTPYLTELKELELEALLSYQLGNFRAAERLHQRVYQLYSDIDHQQGMARQLIAAAQVALVLNDLKVSERLLSDLTILVNSTSFQQTTGNIATSANAELANHLSLLEANLAIQQSEWQSAQSYLDNIDTTNSEIKQAQGVNRAIIAYQSENDTSDALALTSKLKSPLHRARLLRLQAQIAADQGDFEQANENLESARILYRENSFAPGIAAVLTQQAEIQESLGDGIKAERLKLRAAKLKRRLGIQP